MAASIVQSLPKSASFAAHSRSAGRSKCRSRRYPLRRVATLATLMCLVSPFAAAIEVEILLLDTPGRLAATPELLVLTHLDHYTLVADWQGTGFVSGAATPGQPRGVVIAADGTVYLPTAFAVGWKPPGLNLRWKLDVPLPVETAIADREGQLILAAGGSLHLYPEGPNSAEVRVVLPTEVRQNLHLAVDLAGNVAVGSSRGDGGFAVVVEPLANPQIYSYGVSQGLGNQQIREIAVDTAGRFILGTASGVFVATGPVWDLQFARLGAEDGLPSESITALVGDSFGGVAIGTGAGLALWDGDLVAPAITTLTTADGLVSDWIPALTSDGAGHILASQPGGVAVVTLLPEPPGQREGALVVLTAIAWRQRRRAARAAHASWVACEASR